MLHFKFIEIQLFHSIEQFLGTCELKIIENIPFTEMQTTLVSSFFFTRHCKVDFRADYLTNFLSACATSSTSSAFRTFHEEEIVISALASYSLWSGACHLSRKIHVRHELQFKPKILGHDIAMNLIGTVILCEVSFSNFGREKLWNWCGLNNKVGVF